MSILPGPTARDGLPTWAVVTPKRREHVRRVVGLLRDWATALRLSSREAAQWQRAGWLHDALRDADEAELRRWAPTAPHIVELLHGPAAAARAELEGETDDDVLSAVRWHSIGWAGWGAVGRALYCADFLEPGRTFDAAVRAALADRFPDDPDAVVAEVASRRLTYARAEGWVLPPEAIAFGEALSS
ncbi:MAG: hypothetical protein SFU57_05510 [Gemmatimonadales bacterium]|nr:hypothetical protein [Gemmatimonadales bacterium]